MKSPDATTSLPLTAAPAAARKRAAAGKMRLIRELLAPYRSWILIILSAMVVETAMSLAAPWLLKVIFDNVVGTHEAPEWLAPFRGSLLGGHKMELAMLAGIATVIIAALGIAVALAPFLLLFVARLNRAVKRATHEVRHHQSDIVAVVAQGLESIRVVKAFGRQELEESRLYDVSHATVDAALKARRMKSLLSPTVTIVVALCTGFVLWRGTLLVLAGAMTVGALTVFLAYLAKFFKPVQDLAKMSNTLAQTAVA